MKYAKDKVGLWMIGAGGRVGSAVALGVTALSKRLTQPTGLVSALPVFDSVPLIAPGTIVIGGHEVRSETILDAIAAAHEKANLFDENVIRRCAPRLREVQRNLRPGSLYGAGPTIHNLADMQPMRSAGGFKKERSGAAAVARLSADIEAFRRRHALDCVVVIHVASTEPPFRRNAAHARFDKLQRALSRPGSKVLPTSSLYALAAIEAGCPFINFTPSLGVNVPAIQERARTRGVPFMGSDGKTGETLVKSILAPMFAMRHLPVLSWVGQNILGNRDGAVLRDPKTRQSKIQTKDKIVSRIVGRSPTTLVSIDYVPSLDDWKVAWDFIHFEGFLATKMSMQFTWYGSDSILAAPLIIDLVRLAVLEWKRGASGPMPHLGFFFKDPINVHEHDLFTQWRRLVEHVTKQRAADFSPRGATIDQYSSVVARPRRLKPAARKER